ALQALCGVSFQTLQVIGGSVTVVQGGTAMLPCHATDTNDDLTQITWQRKMREKPHNDNFITIQPRNGLEFVNGRDDRFKYVGNFNNRNGTLQLSNAALKDEGSYTCIFTLFPSGNQKTEIPLNLLGVTFTILKRLIISFSIYSSFLCLCRSMLCCLGLIWSFAFLECHWRYMVLL
uniref:Ig-like domain-containing protein n=1 Tax=Pundamilia nyererei TaxID=303518 RepID=A0A3B4G4Z4_9CICH